MKPAPRTASADLSVPIASTPNRDTPLTENVSQDGSVKVCPDWRIIHGRAYENPHRRHMHWSTLILRDRVDCRRLFSDVRLETGREVIYNVSNESPTTIRCSVADYCGSSVRSRWDPTTGRNESTAPRCRCLDHLQRN